MDEKTKSEQLFEALILFQDEIKNNNLYSNEKHLIDNINNKIELLETCKSDLEKHQVLTDILMLLWEYPDANKRFQEIRLKTSPQYIILNNLSIISSELGLNKEEIKKITDAAVKRLDPSRIVRIDANNISKSKSVKLKNLDFNFGEFGELATGIIFTIKNILGETNYLYIAAGILLILASIYKAMEEEISEQEVTVLLGFASIKEKDPSQVEIMNQTNIERKSIGLKSLDKNQVLNSLLKLSSLNVVKKIPGTRNHWRVIEKLIIKRSKQL